MPPRLSSFLSAADRAYASGDLRSLALVAAWLGPHLPSRLQLLSENIVRYIEAGDAAAARSLWEHLRDALERRAA